MHIEETKIFTQLDNWINFMAIPIPVSNGAKIRAETEKQTQKTEKAKTWKIRLTKKFESKYQKLPDLLGTVEQLWPIYYRERYKKLFKSKEKNCGSQHEIEKILIIIIFREKQFHDKPKGKNKTNIMK